MRHFARRFDPRMSGYIAQFATQVYRSRLENAIKRTVLNFVLYFDTGTTSVLNSIFRYATILACPIMLVANGTVATLSIFLVVQ